MYRSESISLQWRIPNIILASSLQQTPKGVISKWMWLCACCCYYCKCVGFCRKMNGKRQISNVAIAHSVNAVCTVAAAAAAA